MAVQKFAGLETEYSLHAYWSEGGVDDTVEPSLHDGAANALLATASRLSGGWTSQPENGQHWLPNGGLLYVDYGAHPEYATPESSDPAAVVFHQRLGDELLANAVAHENANHFDITRLLFKGNVDAYGNTFGTHESYLIPGHFDVEALAPILGSFLATRVLFTGVGGIVLSRSRQPAFVRSHRARFIDCLASHETVAQRALVNLRHEPHADPRRFRRLHLICGEANRCDVATYLKLGTTAIAVAMIEDRVFLDDLIFENPVRVHKTAAHSVNLQARNRTAAGTMLSAIEHQRRFAERAATYVAKRGAQLFARPDVARDVVARWQQVIEDLAVDPLRLYGQLDWVTKQRVLAAKAKHDHIGLGHPRLRQYDLSWGDIGPSGVFSVLDRRDTIERIGATPDLTRIRPPADSRAALRGFLVARHPEILHDVNWSGVALRSGIHGVQFGCVIDDPAHHNERELAESGLYDFTDRELQLHFALALIENGGGFEDLDIGPQQGRAFLACRADAEPDEAARIGQAVANGTRNALDTCIQTGSGESVRDLLDVFGAATRLSGAADEHLTKLEHVVAYAEQRLTTVDAHTSSRANVRSVLDDIVAYIHRSRLTEHGAPEIDLGGR